MVVDFKEKKVIIFDLDGTLALSKSAIDDEMHTLLEKLLEHKKVLVISGGKWRQFKNQFIDHLKLSTLQLSNLFISPGSGSSMYRFEEGEIHEMYAELLSLENKERIREAFAYALEKSGVEIPSTHYGEQLEDRQTEMTFSALGQQAPLEEKEKWDPDHEKRKMIVKYLEEKIPEFEIGIGGTTSIDITQKGKDKSYGVEQASLRLGIPIEKMVYIGDALFPGGNDEEARKSGVECLPVKDVEETKKVIREILY